MPWKMPSHSQLERQRIGRPRDPPRYGQARYHGVWVRIRIMHLRREPLCRVCAAAGKITPADTVDHIVPLREGGTNEESNLQSLCKPCHSSKTNAERNRAGSAPPVGNGDTMTR